MDEVSHMTQADREENEFFRQENLEMRKYYDEDGMKRLMCIMCLGAIHDWRRAEADICAIEMGRSRFRGSYLEGKRLAAEQLKKECEEFFESDIFHGMTGIDGAKEAVNKILKIPLHQLTEIERRHHLL